MNTLRTHTNNLTSLLRRAAIDNTDANLSFVELTEATLRQYAASDEFAAVGTAAEAKAAAKAVKAPKVYPLDADGNPIKPKRGRPVGSRNKKTLAAETATVEVETAVIPTEVVPTEA